MPEYCHIVFAAY